LGGRCGFVNESVEDDGGRRWLLAPFEDGSLTDRSGAKLLDGRRSGTGGGEGWR